MTQSTETNTPDRLPAWLSPWLSWRRKRFWLLVAVVMYALLGHFGVPWLVKRTIVNTFEKAERSAHVEQVRYNPWIFRLSVQGVRVTDTDGVEVLTLGEQVGDFQARSLFLWAWTFRELRVRSLFLDETRFAGADTRLLRLLTALEGPEPPTSDAEPDSGLPRVVVDLLAIEDMRIHFVDHTAGDFETTIGPIDIEVHDLRTLPDNQGRQQVSIETAYGDRIEWQGTLQLGPLVSEGQLRLTGPSLHDTLSYLDHLLPFGLRLDAIDLDLQYRVAETEAGLAVAVRSLDLDIQGLHARMDEADKDIVSLSRIGASGASLDWPAQTARLEHIALQGLSTDAVLAADGSINLMAMVPAVAESAPDAPADPASWQVEVAEIALTDGTIGIRDETVQPAAALVFNDLAVNLNDVNLEDGTQIPVGATATVASGGQVGFKGRVTLFPDLVLDGRANITGLGLKPLETYALPFARIRLDAGTLDLDTELGFGPDQRMQAAGRLAVANLDVTDTVKGERLAGWKALDIDRFEADLQAGTLRSSEVALSEPYGRFHIAEDLSTNISDLLVDAPPTDAEPEQAPLQIAIDGIRFDNAALDFSDFSLPLPFAADIRQLGGRIGALSTQSAQAAEVSLEGQVNEFGLARIEGDLNAWDFTAHADIGMQFRNLDMSRLTPYTVQFAGYAIEDGRLDLDLKYVIDGGQLQGDNSIVIKELDLGEKVEHPGAGSLPLKLAVALLTDTNGVIDIDLPVSGDLNDPSFRISGIVWRALGNLITRAVTAPFRLLGALVGMDSEDFGTLSFGAGRSDLSPPDREQLLKLAQAMQQRPELSLKVGGVVAPAVDRPALQAQRLDALLEAKSAELEAGGEQALERRRLALEALFSERFPGEDLSVVASAFTAPPSAEGEDGVLDEPAYLARLRERLLEAQAVSENDLMDLAQARAEAVVTGLSSATADSAPNVVRADNTEVEATGSGNVPLELAVEAQ